MDRARRRLWSRRLRTRRWARPQGLGERGGGGVNAIILDVETTGIDEPDVVELAATAALISPADIDFDSIEQSEQRFRPRKPISLGALAAHHILETDLESCD